MSETAMRFQPQTRRRSARLGAGVSRHGRGGSDGQVIVIFALSIVMFTLMCAVVVDIAWYWTNNLRMQRAADAAALAGVVWLPGDPASAYVTARAEARKNGYIDGTDGIVVTPEQDPANPRRLKVTISGPVGLFFSRVAGINSFPARRTAKAEFVLPVPMGSPNNYYGVGYYVKPETTTTTTTRHEADRESSGDSHASTSPGTAGWFASSGSLVGVVSANDNAYAYTATNNAVQQWGHFDLLANLDSNETITNIAGIRVTLGDVRLSQRCSNTTNRVIVQISWDDGNSWTNATPATSTGSFTTTNQNDYPLGSTTNTSAWTAPGLNWDVDSEDKLSNANFRVRLQAAKGCATAGTQIRVDEITVRVDYDVDRTVTTTTTTTDLVQGAVVPPPSGQAAITNPQGFWGAMQSQGAPSIQGDAFMTKYETRQTGGGGGLLNTPSGSDPDAQYDPDGFYNYAVEIPAGGGGSVWVFDPGFCDATTQAGTGEAWTVSSSGQSNPNGHPTREPVTSYFELLDTRETLLDNADDISVATTGTGYRRLSLEDHVVFDELGQTTHTADCSSSSWHYGWVQLAAGLPAGTYRLHSWSTDAGAPSDQNNTTALNAFAFYASSASGTPRIYGIGAMEAYVRLPGGRASEFYLAQIDAVHAGKTMVINLWDPGDTGLLSADLEILHPTGFGFASTSFNYRATPGTANPGHSGCSGRSGTGVTSVRTNTGGSSLYNGCWLTIEVALPANYDAPVDPASGERGWWKIKYTMGGSSSDYSTDLTTWAVNIRGNPVHLVLP